MATLSLLHIALIYLAVINVVTFFMYGIDKWKAKKSKWRLREAALLGLAVLGGSIGAWLGMKVWHHKTQHKGGNRDIDNIAWILPQPVLIIGTYDKNGKPNAMNAAWGGQWDMHEIIISLGSHATFLQILDRLLICCEVSMFLGIYLFL